MRNAAHVGRASDFASAILGARVPHSAERTVPNVRRELAAMPDSSSYSVTQRYVALAGRTFADEDARLTERLYGTHENAEAPLT
jgi:hypothetical protein